MFSRKAGGRLFHTAGPLYAKLRCQVEDTHFNAVQQMTKLGTDERRTSVRRVYVKPDVVLGA